MVLYKSLNYRTTELITARGKLRTQLSLRQTYRFLMAANYIDITPVLIRLYFFHNILRDLDAEFLRR